MLRSKNIYYYFDLKNNAMDHFWLFLLLFVATVMIIGILDKKKSKQ